MLAAVITALAFVVFFDLQRRGGPVYLSLVGYAVTAAGVLYSALFFGEPPGWTAYAGMAVIAVSFAFQRRAGREN